MYEEKFFLKSMTIWGVIIAFLTNFLPSIGPLVGIDVTAAMLKELGDAGTALLQAGGAFLAIALIVWGRIRASTLLRWLPWGDNG